MNTIHPLISIIINRKMSEKFSEKENRFGKVYQMRTKQYSNQPLQKQNIFQPKLYDNKETNLLSYQQNLKADYNQRSNYCDSKYERGMTAQWHSKNSESPQKQKVADKNVRFNVYEGFEKYNFSKSNNSYAESSEHSTNNQNKREPARKHELDMKMNNINSINEKINSLLNLVKKDKIDYSSKEKAERSPNSYKRAQSPIVKRQIVKQVQSNEKFMESAKKVTKAEEVDYYKQNSKSIKRLRALSSLEPNLSNKKAKAQFQQNSNQSLRKYNEEQYVSPSKNKINHLNNQEKINDRSQDKYYYGSIEKNEGKYSKYSPIRQNGNSTGQLLQSKEKYQRTDNRKVVEYTTPPKYCQPPKIVSSQRFEWFEKSQNNPSHNEYENSFMPVTLVQDEYIQREPEQRYVHNYSGMKMIDDQLKRIKGKLQSSNQNIKNQQKFESLEKQNCDSNSSFVSFPKTQSAPNKRFELKIYPVQTDRIQTIKMAQRLSNQAQMDNRMRKPWKSFLKIEGQQYWRDLERKFNRNGIRYTIDEIKYLVSVFSDDFNSLQNEEQSNQGWNLVEQFSQAQIFWEDQVCGCASLRALKNEGFDANELDPSSQGLLSIEGLVSFVNKYTGRFYKNKDLALIQKRLQLLQGSKKQGYISFQTFVRTISH